MARAVLTGSTTLTYGPPEAWRSLYSDEWAGAPRQVAPEFCAAEMKDCGALIGLPDQWNFYHDPWIELTEVRARWLFDIQCLSWKGARAAALPVADLITARMHWKQLFDDGRCFTNHSGTDSHHDWINATHALADNMSYQLLLLGGNFVDVLGPTEILSESYFGIQKGYPHRKIRAVDIDHLPTPESVVFDPEVCHLCTTIQPDGTRGIFPQFDGRARGVIWAKGGSAYVWERLIGKL